MKKSIYILFSLLALLLSEASYGQTSLEFLNELTPHYEKAIVENSNNIKNFENAIAELHPNKVIHSINIKISSLEPNSDDEDAEIQYIKGIVDFILRDENGENIIKPNFTLTCDFTFYVSNNNAYLSVTRGYKRNSNSVYRMGVFQSVLKIDDLNL